MNMTSTFTDSGSQMKATRRTVLGWLLAAAIAPPKFSVAVEPAMTYKEWICEQFARRLEEALLFGPKTKSVVLVHPKTMETINRVLKGDNDD